MRAAPDDEFKLRFPVAKDRTLRRIAIAQLFIYVMALSSVAIFITSSATGYYISGGRRDVSNSTTAAICGISGIVFALSFPAAWIVAIIEARVQVRRYGWRAVKDPIEAQRVAMREALYDVATGSTRPDVELDRDGDRIMVVPIRRLRPVGARLELTAERDRAQTSHEP